MLSSPLGPWLGLFAARYKAQAAAFFETQLDYKKLPTILQRRKEIHAYLSKALKKLDNYFVLPKVEDNSERVGLGFF